LIILTGYAPYGKYKSNLSSEIAEEFSFKNDNFTLKKEIIPVSWKRSIDSYKNLLLKLRSKPELVVLLGIHSSKKYHLERFGWNFKIGEDIERKFKIGFIKYWYPLRIKTTLNLNKTYSYIKDKSKISISNYAGSYLCNYLYYWALYISNREYPVIFIHIPDKGNVSECVKKVRMIIKAIIKINFKDELHV
jgi:pyrrolidone-carboxylate peptidase